MRFGEPPMSRKIGLIIEIRESTENEKDRGQIERSVEA